MRPLHVVFTGSAEELRQHGRRDLWINIVLGGLYTSVARQHRAQYLASRTTIDGTAPEHVRVAKSRWPAIVLAAAFIAFRLANEFGHGPPLPVLVICGVLLVPYVWGTLTARSVGALRWRELPLSFTARWSEIYAASWPLLVLGVAWAWFEPAVTAAAARGDVDSRFAAGAVAAAVVAFPLLAALAFNLRRLRFARTRVGTLAVMWPARFRAWLRLWSLTAVSALATAIAPVLLVRYALLGTITLQDRPGATTWTVYAVSLLLIVLLSGPTRAWHEAQAFALAWNGVRVGDGVRVECTLDTGAFVRMRIADELAHLAHVRAATARRPW